MCCRRSRSARPRVVGLVLAGAAVPALVLGPRPAPALGARAAPVAARAAADDHQVVHYQPPVDAEVLDPFRLPGHRYGPGNRGIDYGTAPGTPVGAAAPGVVAFAGAVGGGRHVTVLHADGVRTTYAFLGTVAVRRGRRVAAGEVVGHAAGPFHFGARIGEEYVDPRLLFGTGPPGERMRARLVPDPGEAAARPGNVAAERRSLARLVRALPRFAGRAAARSAQAVGHAVRRVPRVVADLAARDERLRLWLLQSRELTPSAWAAVGADVAAAMRGRPCTPVDRAPPPPSRRRLAVLVAGLGSSSTEAAVDRVDTGALGYAASDVHRFSYRGGTTRTRPYRASHTVDDLAGTGERLTRLLRHLADNHPGTPIDVIAHSQGGLVARAALVPPRRPKTAAPAPPPPPAVRTLVTLGTPHQGADLAAGALTARTPAALAAVAEVLAGPNGDGILVDRRSVVQLAPGSSFLRGLAGGRLPAHVRAVSVAARYDVIVASHRSRFPGAADVVVTIPAVDQHTSLPGSAAATREIALAVAGLPPTCRSPADTALDSIAARVIAAGQVALASQAVSKAIGAGRSVVPPGRRAAGVTFDRSRRRPRRRALHQNRRIGTAVRVDRRPDGALLRPRAAVHDRRPVRERWRKVQGLAGTHGRSCARGLRPFGRWPGRRWRLHLPPARRQTPAASAPVVLVSTRHGRSPTRECRARSYPRSPAAAPLPASTTDGRRAAMAVVSMKQLLEAGVHFGHQTRRWNPKMRRFIFGERNGIYIIDLHQTLQGIEKAYTYVRDLVSDGGTILFVGTKKQTQDPVARYAAQCGMPYINERWLGGMLTNFATISTRVKKMQEYERMKAAGDFEAMPKKEALILSRELEKLQRNLGGIRGMSRLPDAIFVIDTKKEHIAVTEANRLALPIVAVVDTNCDPDVITYVIPGNDDAIRSGSLMCRVIADAVEEGRFIASRRAARTSAAAGGPAERTAEDEARVAQQQSEARRQAALQAQEREARMRAAAPAEGSPDETAPAASEPAATPEPAAPAASEPAAAPEPAATTPEPAAPAASEPAAAPEPAATTPEPAAAEPEPAAAEPEAPAAPASEPAAPAAEPESAATDAAAAEAATTTTTEE